MAEFEERLLSDRPGRDKLDKYKKEVAYCYMKLTAAFKQVDGWWAAFIEEIPGVHT